MRATPMISRERVKQPGERVASQVRAHFRARILTSCKLLFPMIPRLIP
jgi:hypothetical protein